MAKQEAPATVQLTDERGNTIAVSADKADRLLAGSGYTKATARKATAKSAD